MLCLHKVLHSRVLNTQLSGSGLVSSGQADGTIIFNSDICTIVGDYTIHECFTGSQKLVSIARL